MKKWLKEMFSDSGGFASSKRGLGALCIVFAMIMAIIVFFGSEPHGISPDIRIFLMSLVASGTTLLGISILEKK